MCALSCLLASAAAETCCPWLCTLPPPQAPRSWLSSLASWPCCRPTRPRWVWLRASRRAPRAAGAAVGRAAVGREWLAPGPVLWASPALQPGTSFASPRRPMLPSLALRPAASAALPALQTFTEDGFYVWLYERPVSPWAYVWTALIPRAPGAHTRRRRHAACTIPPSWGLPRAPARLRLLPPLLMPPPCPAAAARPARSGGAGRVPVPSGPQLGQDWSVLRHIHPADCHPGGDGAAQVALGAALGPAGQAAGGRRVRRLGWGRMATQETGMAAGCGLAMRQPPPRCRPLRPVSTRLPPAAPAPPCSAVALATWLLTGSTLWLLPNLMSEVGALTST